MSTARANPQHGRPPASDVAYEVSTWAVGGGIIVTALFPLAIPILALTAVAALPLALIPLAAGLALAVVAVPVLVLRALGRRVLKAMRPVGTGRPRAASPSQ